MQGFDALNINLSHFNPQDYYYPPTGLPAQAFQVTDDNIGALVVDFNSDLEYGNEDDLPYFTVKVNRTDIEGGTTVRVFDVYLHDWIVLLRGELHFFHEKHFFATFASVNGAFRAAEEAGMLEQNPNWEQAEKETVSPKDLFDGVHKSFQIDKKDVERTEIGAPVPTPTLRPVFKPGLSVTAPDDRVGEIVEGPTRKGDYFVKFDDGGANWYNEADIRIQNN